MDKTIQIRNTIRKFISTQSKWLLLVGRFVVALVSFGVINLSFGYLEFLRNPIIAIALSLGCAFIPISAGSLVVVAYGLVHLSALSSQVSMAALLNVVLFYAISYFYGARYKYNITYTPISYQIGMPYVFPLTSALFGKGNEIAAVIGGGIFSFFLNAVKESSSAFLDDTVEISIIDVILQKMIVNQMFYIYMFAIVTLFFVVYYIKNSKLKHSWIYASAIGLVAEMVIMLAGYLFTGNINKIPMLIIANVICFVIALIITYAFRNLDYDRVEKVQFEDDEYVYYVTAIPKIEVPEEEKKVQRITEYKSKIKKDTKED